MAPRNFIELPLLTAYRKTVPSEILEQPQPDVREYVRELKMQIWIENALLDEARKLGSTTKKIEVPRTYLFMMDHDYFLVNGILYDEVRIVFGEVATHWFFYKHGTREELKGRAEITCSFCHCCARKNFGNLIGAIREACVDLTSHSL